MVNALSNKNGFGLIELMVSVMIVGILSAIAIPIYSSRIDKTKINTAIADIYSIQTCLERFYTINSKYPDLVSDVSSCLPHSGVDPWGNAYEYLNLVTGDPGKSERRQDHKLNPINTYFDLFSKGKNGVSKKQITNEESIDDIIFARDGGYVGLASDF